MLDEFGPRNVPMRDEAAPGHEKDGRHEPVGMSAHMSNGKFRISRRRAALTLQRRVCAERS
jgi:hypothetical protein